MKHPYHFIFFQGIFNSKMCRHYMFSIPSSFQLLVYSIKYLFHLKKTANILLLILFSDINYFDLLTIWTDAQGPPDPLINTWFWFTVKFLISGYGKFLLRLIGFAMFGATFNLVTSVGLPYFLEQWKVIVF